MKILFNHDGVQRPDQGVRAVIRSLHLGEETGVLRLRSAAEPEVDMYFQGGRLVACTSDLDEERITQLAMDLGPWDRRALRKLRQTDPALPVLRLLQERKLLGEDQLQLIADRCVRANLRLAFGTRWREASFDHADAVFPACVSLSIEIDEWLDDASGEFPRGLSRESAISTEYHLDRASLRGVGSDDDDDPDPRPV